MVRELTSHKVNGLNEAICIGVMDEPGPGGANHVYDLAPLIDVDVPREDAEQGVTRRRIPVEESHVVLRFQNGPIGEAGVNGISQEALLAIVEDRLVGFQSGQYATADNAEALDHVRKAMECLHRRTKERMARGVEGTLQK